MQITQSMAMESVSFSPLGTGSPSPSIVLLPLSSLSLADNTLDVSFQLFLNQIRPRSYMLKELRIASIPSELLLPRQQSISVDRAATARSDQLAGAAFAARSFDRSSRQRGILRRGGARHLAGGRHRASFSRAGTDGAPHFAHPLPSARELCLSSV